MDLLVEKYNKTQSFRRLHFELGRSNLYKERFAKAVDEFRTAWGYVASSEFEKEPKNWEIRYLLGKSLEQVEGEILKAIHEYLLGTLENESNEVLLINNATQHLTKAIAEKLNGWLQENWVNRFAIPTGEAGKIAYHSFLSKFYFHTYRLEEANNHSLQLLKLDPAHSEIVGILKKIEGHSRLDHIQSLIDEGKYSIALEEIQKNIPEIHALGEDYQFKLELLKLNSLYAKGDWDVYAENDLEERILLSDGILQKRKKELRLGIYIIKIKTYIAQHHYGLAIDKVEQALRIESLNTNILFLKVQSLIEGQIDIEEGMRLLELIKDDITNTVFIQEILKLRREDGNAHLFLAYYYFLTGEDEQRIKEEIGQAKEWGLNNNLEEANRRKYLDIGFQVLDGQIALRNKKLVVAASTLFELGRRYNWQIEYEKAIFSFDEIEVQCLNQSNVTYDDVVAINKDFEKYFWTYSNSLYQVSRLESPPYLDKKTLEHANDVWDQSKESAITSAEDIWVYSTKALIHDSRFRFVDTQAKNEHWKAAYYMERALIHEKNDVWSLTNLAKYYNHQELYINGIQMAERANRMTNNMDSLSELTTLYLNKGLFNASEELRHTTQANIELLISKSDNESSRASYYGWQGFIAHHSRNYTEAIRFFDKNIEGNSNDYWAYSMKMASLWQNSQIEKAQEVATKILALFRDEDLYPNAKHVLGNANYVLGKLENAQELIQVALDRFEKNATPSIELLLVYLRNGLLSKANKGFKTFINDYPSLKTVRELEAELWILEKPELNFLTDAAQLNVLQSWKKEIMQIVEQGESSLTATEELERELLQHRGGTGTYAWVALQAGLARLRFENKDYRESMAIYRKLDKSRLGFPESKLAIKIIEEELLKVNQGLFADEQFLTVVKNLGYIKNSEKYLEVSSQLILAYLGLKKTRAAQIKLMKTLEKIYKNIEEPEREVIAFTKAISNNIKDFQFYEELDTILVQIIDTIKNKNIIPLLQNMQIVLAGDADGFFTPKSNENELHPIIDDILEAIRKRTEIVEGKKIIAEEFVLPNEAIPELKNKLLSITDSEERKEALLSIFAFCQMVEKQGWKDNAQKIKDLGEVYDDLYFDLQRIISARLAEQAGQEPTKSLGNTISPNKDVNDPLKKGEDKASDPPE